MKKFLSVLLMVAGLMSCGDDDKPFIRLYRYCPWMRGMATSQISCNNGIDKKASHVPL